MPNESLRTDHAARHSAADSHTLVRRAIHVMENAIYNKFGYVPIMGAELEFCLRLNPSLPNDRLQCPIPALGNSEANKALRGYEPSLARVVTALERNPALDETARRAELAALQTSPFDTLDIKKPWDPMFPKSPFVCYSYKEHQGRYPFYKYEAVVSHDAHFGPMIPPTMQTEAEGESVARPLNRMNTYAHVIQSLRSSLKHGMTDAQHKFAGTAAWKQFRDQYVEDVLLDPFIAVNDNQPDAMWKDYSCGMHMTVSLFNPSTRSIMEDQDEMLVLKKHLVDASYHGLAMLGTDAAARQRYTMYENQQNLRDYVRYCVPGAGSGTNNSYLENRFASSSSDPYYAVLLNLVGIYNAMEHLKAHGSAHAVPTREGRIDEAFDTAEQRLADPKNPVRCTLNQVEEGLGDSVFENVIAHGVSSEIPAPVQRRSA